MSFLSMFRSGRSKKELIQINISLIAEKANNEIELKFSRQHTANLKEELATLTLLKDSLQKRVSELMTELEGK